MKFCYGPICKPTGSFFPTFKIVEWHFCQRGSPGTMSSVCKRSLMQDYSYFEFSCATRGLSKAGVFNYSCWLPWKTNLIQALNLPTWKPSVAETLCEGNKVFSRLRACLVLRSQAQGALLYGNFKQKFSQGKNIIKLSKIGVIRCRNYTRIRCRNHKSWSLVYRL